MLLYNADNQYFRKALSVCREITRLVVSHNLGHNIHLNGQTAVNRRHTANQKEKFLVSHKGKFVLIYNCIAHEFLLHCNLTLQK